MSIGLVFLEDKMMKIATINGKDTRAPDSAVAWKYADPTEDAKWIYDESEAREIEREADYLIEWVKDSAAVSLGRRGGAVTSDAKSKSSAKNGKLGGRPSLREQAERRVDASPKLTKYKAFIMADWNEGAEHWRWVIRASVSEIVDWAKAGK